MRDNGDNFAFFFFFPSYAFPTLFRDVTTVLIESKRSYLESVFSYIPPSPSLALQYTRDCCLVFFSTILFYSLYNVIPVLFSINEMKKMKKKPLAQKRGWHRTRRRREAQFE